jgi:hypothetical protein
MKKEVVLKIIEVATRYMINYYGSDERIKELHISKPKNIKVKKTMLVIFDYRNICKIKYEGIFSIEVFE